MIMFLMTRCKKRNKVTFFDTKTRREKMNEMQKKGIDLPIYNVPYDCLGVQKTHKIIEYLAPKLWEPNLSKIGYLIG